MARLTVNDQPVEYLMDPATPLLWALRDASNLTGAKYGCGTGQCGACTVDVDGEAVRSCRVAIGSIEGSQVTTIEGLSREREHPVQLAFIASGVPQCGFCVPGMVMAAAARLGPATSPRPAPLRAALQVSWGPSARPRPLRIAGGGGWKSDALKQHLATLEAAGRVQRLGYVPDDELSRLYASAFGFVFPSWHEGFGLPVLEALGYGTPVICSDRASLPEVGGDAAMYVDPASAESICAAMLALEADPGRRAALAEAGRRQAARFSWERTARETLAFYERVLGR